MQRKFYSKRDAQGRAKAVHMCVACMHKQEKTWENNPCPACGESGTRQYFMSKIEQNRGAELILMQKQGIISHLRFQPRYKLEVNGHKIGAYVADSEYRRDGKTVVEDVKPFKFMDDVARIKIALFNAIYGPLGLSVHIDMR